MALLFSYGEATVAVCGCRGPMPGEGSGRVWLLWCRAVCRLLQCVAAVAPCRVKAVAVYPWLPFSSVAIVGGAVLRLWPSPGCHGQLVAWHGPILDLRPFPYDKHAGSSRNVQEKELTKQW